jgi:hypothetical protein
MDSVAYGSGENTNPDGLPEFEFAYGDTGQVDPEIEALLNTILQPHLNVGIGGYEQGPSYH